MLPKKYARLILVFTALFTVFCMYTTDNKDVNLAGHDCKFAGTVHQNETVNGQFIEGIHSGTFTCKNPDGSTLICPYTNEPVSSSTISGQLTESDLNNMDFWGAFGCFPPAPATSTPTASPVPTATATFLPTATPGPLLSGKVSACSTKDGFINFNLAAISPLVNESDILLTINGAQVSCTFAGSDNSLLSCPLPAGVAFPAQIQVAQGNTPVNDFSYDGGGCVSATGPSNNGGGATGEGGGPAPTPCLGDVCGP